MFDLGWAELMLIGVVVLFVMGPEDIPKLMYQLGRGMRRLQYIRYAMSSQFEDFMKQADIKADEKDKDEMTPIADTHANEEDEADLYLMDDMPPPDHVEDIDITHTDDDKDQEIQNDATTHKTTD